MKPGTASLSRQITGLSYAFALILVSVLGSFGWWAASRIDDQAIAKETRSLQNELVEVVERLPSEVVSSLGWDTNVLTSQSSSTAWQDEIVEWMSNHRGPDKLLLLDKNNLLVGAVDSGVRVSPDLYSSELQAFLPLIGDLRRQMAQSSVDEEKSMGAGGTPFVLDFIRPDSGRAQAIGIRPLITDFQRAPGAEYLIVSIRFLNGSLVEELRERTELADLEFELTEVTGSGRIAIPVLENAGRIVGFFSWTPYEPAYNLIKETFPMIAAGILAAIIAVSLLLRRLQRTSTILEATKEEASFLAFHDPLTSIPNRALFEDRLEQALVNMRRTGSAIALHYVDLDRFKHVNDTLGHPAGDELIRSAARRLSELVDEVDTVARLGGDEFAIIQFQPVSKAAAEELSQKVVDIFSHPVPVAGVEALIGASVGVIVTADASLSAADLMRQADIALYQAKDSGRGQYRLFADELGEAVHERRTLEIELRNALASSEGLELVYQPIFRTDGSLAGAEALIRWNHPVRGRMFPDVFIGLAEERGIIAQLGMWVLYAACTFAVEAALPWVAVNVSPLQFRDERFAEGVREVLKKTNLPASRLQIEITEGLLLQNSPRIQAILRELRADGIRIALDDFGTGYSSISYLLTHGIDKLKIDQSFTAQLGIDQKIEGIVRSIVDLGRAMDMVVTAEGVETAEQQAVLSRMGCDELQGYLYSQPISAALMSSFMIERGQLVG